MRLEIPPGQLIRGNFRVVSKHVRDTKGTGRYALLSLESGSLFMTGYLFEGCERIVKNIKDGETVYVVGMGKETPYMPVVKVLTIGLDPSEKEGKVSKESWSKFMSFMYSVRKSHLRALISLFLTDREFLKSFLTSPGGIKLHHVGEGGLMEHTTSVIEVALQLGKGYFEKRNFFVDRDLLIVGGFLHDAGKTVSIGSAQILNMPLGHIGQGLILLDRAAREIDSFPRRDLMCLYHIIETHHAHKGSSLQPLTPEAILINLADKIDSELDGFTTPRNGIGVSPSL